VKYDTCLLDILDVMDISLLKLLNQDLDLLLQNAKGSFNVLSGCFLPSCISLRCVTNSFVTSLHKSFQLWVDAINKKPELIKYYAIDLKFKVDITSEGSIDQETLQEGTLVPYVNVIE
jgi:hypothetical protein